MQPQISEKFRVSPSKSTPPRTAKTDSLLNIIVAITGFAAFCPKIWRVYATAVTIIPMNKIGRYPAIIFVIAGFSNANINGKESIPATKN